VTLLRDPIMVCQVQTGICSTMTKVHPPTLWSQNGGDGVCDLNILHHPSP